MNYFVTGGTGFVGRFLIGKLLERGGTVYALVREGSTSKLDALRERHRVGEERIIGVTGDITSALLGLSPADIERLKGNVDHFFHVAAIYDMKASEESQQIANVEGTRHAVQCAKALDVGCMHHVSSIAASGLYKGTFREDMFTEAEHLDHPYFRTKHDSEGVVREECEVPWRVYRPAAVVGHSKTGEIDKIDGPYYMFGMLKKLRELLPPWMPIVGVDSGLVNVVPVDYVVEAMDYIAHQPDLDGGCFHLSDPDHYAVGELVNVFAEAGHAPKMAMRFDSNIFGFIPSSLTKMISSLPPAKRVKQALFDSIGIPEEAAILMKYQTRYDRRETERALQGSGIDVPRLSSYASRVWDYWERNLDPELFVDRSLEGNVRGKVVVVTGSSSGIGEATARRLADAGATIILTARNKDKLETVQKSIEARGGVAHAYSCDISDLESCDRFVAQVLEDHGHVDILINNAGRSIRRSISLSYERFHDFERTMQLNYFGALRLILGFLPAMSKRKGGHIMHISSIGVLSSSPRFSAYVASKSALDAFMRCAGSEYSDLGIHFTTVNMPLVKTPMIAPTKLYEYAPTLEVHEAVDLVVDGIVHKQRQVATTMGIFLAVANALAPKLMEVIWNTSYRMFPDSAAAQGVKDKGKAAEPSSEQVALAAIMKGVHF